jgi:hypothetical protein
LQVSDTEVPATRIIAGHRVHHARWAISAHWFQREAAGGEKEVEQLLGKLAPAEPHECGPRTASGEPDGYRRTVIALVSV